METASRKLTCCGLNLRIQCFIIGYLNLLASVVDIACHVMTVAILTSGFQCDIDNESLRAINTPWLEPMLLILNLGTHGFYPFPRIFRNQYNVYVDYMVVAAEPKCYPGMLHVYLVDILNFLINVIWLRIVISYVSALHKRNPEPMRMFFTMSVIKLAMQVMYFGYQPAFHDVFTVETYWFLKLLDILIAISFLIIVKRYTNALRAEVPAQTLEQPPSYIECLINGSVRCTKETKDDTSHVNKDIVIPVEERKPDVK